jgi:Protein of unknown function (DUF3828)
VAGLRTLLSCALVAALCVVVSMAAAAPAPSPQSFVEAIYKTYLGKAAKGIELTEEAVIRRYFAPPLADAIVKDRAEADKRGEVPTLDGDPFVDAQDFEIARLRVSTKPAGADAAIATVSFTNLKKPTTMTLDLVKISGTWRIADIKGPSGSLRDLMKVK